MTFIYIGAVIVFGTLVGLIAYLYRESAIIQGKTEIGVGPIKLKLDSHAKKNTHDSAVSGAAETPPASKIE